MSDTKTRLTLAIDDDVLTFARQSALDTSTPGALKPTAEVLRELMREGKQARERKTTRETPKPKEQDR